MKKTHNNIGNVQVSIQNVKLSIHMSMHRSIVYSQIQKVIFQPIGLQLELKQE